MPEPLGLLWSVPESKSKAPIIKVSCGIGDTDGYPAFDVDSDAYATKDDSRWGFLITGGAEFHMPLTVFQVSCVVKLEVGMGVVHPWERDHLVPGQELY